jgi:hypothetical protein
VNVFLSWIGIVACAVIAGRTYGIGAGVYVVVACSAAYAFGRADKRIQED